MIFGKEEDVLPYALCAVMIYWERAVVKRRSPKRWKKYAMRNMVLHAMRLCAEKAVQLTLPPENAPAKEKTAYFSALHRLFCNPEKADALADIAYDVVNNACAGKHMKMDSQSARDPELTLEIASQVNKLKLPKNL
jgi:hypothetical protein